MDKKNLFLTIGYANQDQAIEQLKYLLSTVDLNDWSHFIDFLQDDNPQKAKEYFNDLPDAWIEFMKLGTIVGLRQAVIQYMENPTENS